MVALGIIITCILIGLGIVSIGNIREAYNTQNEGVVKLKQEYLDDGLDRYNGVQITGAEVLNAIKALQGKYNITVKNDDLNSLDILASTDTSTLYAKYKDSNGKSNPMYVNPNGVYYSVLVESDNGKSIKINFTKKAGTAEDLGVSDQETVELLKRKYLDILTDFLNEIDTRGQAILNDKFSEGSTYGQSSFTDALGKLEVNMPWTATSGTTLAYMNVQDDLLNVLANYITEEMNSDTAVDPGGDDDDDSDSDDDSDDDTEKVDYVTKYLNVLHKLTGSYGFYEEDNKLVFEKYFGIASSLDLSGFYITSTVTSESALGDSTKKELASNWVFDKVAEDAFLNHATINTIKLANGLVLEDYAFRNAGITSIYLPSGYTFETMTMFGDDAFAGMSTKGSEITLYVHEDDVVSIDKLSSTLNSISGSVTFTPNQAGTQLGTIDFFGIKGARVVQYSSTTSEIDGFTFTIDDKTASNPSVTITGYVGSTENLVIPSTLTDPSTGVIYDVRGLSNNAFEGREFKSVVINANENYYIPNRAFATCAELTSVVLNGVTRVNAGAFRDCSSLSSVTFAPNSATTDSNAIYASAFYGCSKDLVFYVYSTYNDTVTTTNYNGNAAFPITSKAYDLLTGFKANTTHRKEYEDYTIEIVNKDVDNTYANKPVGESVTIDNWILTSIGEQSFSIKPVSGKVNELIDASGNLTIPSTVMNGTEIYTVKQVATSAFTAVNNLKSVTIEDGITSIAETAFRSCGNLTTVSMNVETIGKDAFNSCVALTTYDFGDSLLTIGEGAFSGCTGLTSIKIPASVTHIYSTAFQGCKNATSIVIGDDINASNIKEIHQQAFEGITALSDFTSYSTARTSDEGYSLDSTMLDLSGIPDGSTSASYTVHLVYTAKGGLFADFKYGRDCTITEI